MTSVVVTCCDLSATTSWLSMDYCERTSWSRASAEAVLSLFTSSSLMASSSATLSAYVLNWPEYSDWCLDCTSTKVLAQTKERHNMNDWQYKLSNHIANWSRLPMFSPIGLHSCPVSEVLAKGLHAWAHSITSVHVHVRFMHECTALLLWTCIQGLNARTCCCNFLRRILHSLSDACKSSCNTQKQNKHLGQILTTHTNQRNVDTVHSRNHPHSEIYDKSEEVDHTAN